jgi:hypothetical protein
MSKRNSLQPVPVIHLATASPVEISKSSCSEEREWKKKAFYRYHMSISIILILLIIIASAALLWLLVSWQYYSADGRSADTKAFRGADVGNQPHKYYVNDIDDNYYVNDIDDNNHNDGNDDEEIEEADPNNYALAHEQSFGFFYDITNEHWNLYRQLYLQHENHRYPEKPLTYNPEAREEDAVPEIYANRNSQWKGWSSYEGWYQTVSMC